MKFYEYHTDLADGAFGQIAPIAKEFSKEVTENLKNELFADRACAREESEQTYQIMIGMEIPPVTGFYAVKLWALDTMLYNNIVESFEVKPWLFNVPYLKFINGKFNTKHDTQDMISQIVEVFKDNGYSVSTNLQDKRGKDRKLTSNQCDSFLYCLRMLCKYNLENGITNPMLAEVLNINDKFATQKETEFGKDLSKK